MLSMRLERLNENTFLLRFSGEPGAELAIRIAETVAGIRTHLGDDLLNWVAANTTLMLEFDDRRVSASAFANRLEAVLQAGDFTTGSTTEGRHHRIPVLYDNTSGPDLEIISQRLGWTRQQVIDAHTSARYTVYAVGFIPGFAYMGDVHPQLASPRHATPRQQVPAGSVGIAESQTGIYPRPSPGGWNIIGRTPVSVLAPLEENGNDAGFCRFQVGDSVTFYAITAPEFAQWKE